MSVLTRTSTIDHATIREWADQRGANPAVIAATSRDGDVGILRLDFGDDPAERMLRSISWDAWLAKFDAQQLAFEFSDDTSPSARAFRLTPR